MDLSRLLDFFAAGVWRPAHPRAHAYLSRDAHSLWQLRLRTPRRPAALAHRRPRDGGEAPSLRSASCLQAPRRGTPRPLLSALAQAAEVLRAAVCGEVQADRQGRRCECRLPCGRELLMLLETWIAPRHVGVGVVEVDRQLAAEQRLEDREVAARVRGTDHPRWLHCSLGAIVVAVPPVALLGEEVLGRESLLAKHVAPHG